MAHDQVAKGPRVCAGPGLDPCAELEPLAVGPGGRRGWKGEKLVLDAGGCEVLFLGSNML